LIKTITVTGLNESIAWLQRLAGGAIDNAVANGLTDWADPVLEQCIAETPFDTGSLRSTEQVYLEDRKENGHVAIAFEAGGAPGTGPWKTINPIGKSGNTAPDYVDYALDIHENGGILHPIHEWGGETYDCEGGYKFLEGPILRNLPSLDGAIANRLKGLMP
jgi:hypothetical protein